MALLQRHMAWPHATNMPRWTAGEMKSELVATLLVTVLFLLHSNKALKSTKGIWLCQDYHHRAKTDVNFFGVLFCDVGNGFGVDRICSGGKWSAVKGTSHSMFFFVENLQQRRMLMDHLEMTSLCCEREAVFNILHRSQCLSPIKIATTAFQWANPLHFVDLLTQRWWSP